MKMTVSMSVGRVAILHDIRQEISANVDVNLTHQNTIFIDKLREYNYDVEAYTNATFQPVIDEYNQKQTRDDRKKTTPYVDQIKEENAKLLRKAEENKLKGIKVNTRKPTRLCHEYVLQFGNRDTNGTLTGDVDCNREAAQFALRQFQERYPHADVLLATFHADEPNGTFHTHVLVQFVGEGYQKGLSKQISMSKALELDGFERSQNRGNYAINRWTNDVQDNILEPVMAEVLHADREFLDEHRQHEDIVFFREKAKREAAALELKVKEAEQRTSEAVKSSQSLKDEITLLNHQKNEKEAYLAKLEGKVAHKESALERLNAEISNFFAKVSEMFNTMIEGFSEGIKKLQPDMIHKSREKFERDYVFGDLDERFRMAYKDATMHRADRLRDEALEQIKNYKEKDI